MQRKCLFKAAFQKAFDALSNEKQTLALKALEAIDLYLKSGQAPYGLRIKKLYESGFAKTFEARVSIDLRIVWVQTKEEIIFSLMGTHDDVRRFIKNLK